MSNTIYRYYVYAYLRSNGTPYYIGKGCNKRAYKDHGHIHVPKDKSRIIFLETNLSNVGACALERRYIRWYGRKDLNTGILRNMTDGGEGKYNCYVSEHTRHKLRLAATGKTNTLQQKAKISAANKGRFHTQESKIKISNAHKNKPKSQEHKRKISQSLLGKSNKGYKRKHPQMWITNGVINTRIRKDSVIPENYRQGKIERQKNLI
jgi:hypothetical protein